MIRTITAEQAVHTIRPGSSVIFPHGCGEARTIMQALARNANALKGIRLFSGVLFSDYQFLSSAISKDAVYYTWHTTYKLHDLVDKGVVEYIPLRASQIDRFLSSIGIDVLFIHVSPPNGQGYCSLGVAVNHTLSLIAQAKLVIAEINRQMPHTFGESLVHLSQIDYFVETDYPLINYPASGTSEVIEKVCANVLTLIPDRSVIQVGLGAVPEYFLRILKHAGKRVSIWGMGLDALVDLAEAGVLSPFPHLKRCSVLCTDLVGTERLFRFAHQNPLMEMRPSSFTTDPRNICALPGFVSLNSAFQVDLWGQVNTEAVGGTQVSGIGGGFDFVEGALRAPGGKSIVALPSLSPRTGLSSIVPRLAGDVPVTFPRHAVQYIVTEFGVADLTGKSLRERARALTAVAHPDVRESLREEFAIPLQRRR